MPRQVSGRGVRSGRFKANDASAGLSILTVPAQQTYRVINGSDDPFEVVVGAAAAVPVQAGASYDFTTNAVVTVKIVSDKSVQGVYERLNSDGDVRPGRFVTEAAPAAAIELVGTVPTNTAYRVINATPPRENGTLVPISLQIDANANQFSLAPECSLDVAATTRIAVIAADNILGSYEFLNGRAGVKSGRFKWKDGGTATEKVIIDFTGAAVEHVYRVVNAGRTVFDIKGNAAAPLATVRRDQSFDFYVSNATNPKVSIVGRANKQVQGIVEYLGRAVP